MWIQQLAEKYDRQTLEFPTASVGVSNTNVEANAERHLFQDFHELFRRWVPLPIVRWRGV